jgi:hypothetical protein
MSHTQIIPTLAPCCQRRHKLLRVSDAQFASAGARLPWREGLVRSKNELRSRVQGGEDQLLPGPRRRRANHMWEYISKRYSTRAQPTANFHKWTELIFP